jgi:hypothetical protein
MADALRASDQQGSGRIVVFPGKISLESELPREHL